MVCLVEIASFDALRRALGPSTADCLVARLIGRFAALAPALITAPLGRATIEVTGRIGQLSDVDALIGGLRKVVATSGDDGWLDRAEPGLQLRCGAAAAPASDADDLRLIEEAESALAEARREGRDVVRNLSAGTPAFDRLALTRDLPGAIADGQMLLEYQPKMHVRRQAIASAEALVRWRHPTRGLIMPNHFILIAEEVAQIGALTLWTLDRVVADQQLLRQQGLELPVFINISGQLLGDATFVAQALDRIAGTATPIGIEITETSVIRDPVAAISNLNIFAKAGIPIAIDDYGAGLSSLAYLKQLPARELKIDKLFVSNLTSSHRDPLIVRSTIDLAHALDMEVTAEGVETQAALALLAVMGCDMVQGYLISRPLPIERLATFIREERSRADKQTPNPLFVRPQAIWATR